MFIVSRSDLLLQRATFLNLWEGERHNKPIVVGLWFTVCGAEAMDFDDHMDDGDDLQDPRWF